MLLPYAPHYIFNTLPYADDLAAYFWPLMHRVAVVLRSGSLPLWSTGSHTIEFVFEPWSVRAGFFISLFSMVAAALICLATTGAMAARAGFRRCA
jgi:hypothetical protein